MTIDPAILCVVLSLLCVLGTWVMLCLVIVLLCVQIALAVFLRPKQGPPEGWRKLDINDLGRMGQPMVMPQRPQQIQPAPPG